jgi:Leucine-rich repeat (LRR) protein
MKIFLLLIAANISAFGLTFTPPTVTNDSSREGDSLALVSLWHITNPDFWDTRTPIDTWVGIEVENDRVVSLDLTAYDSETTRGIRANGIALPSEIGNLTELRYLNLSGRAIHTIPEEISNLQSLETLILSDNVISSLPVEITELTNLTTVDVSYNEFSESSLQGDALSWLETNDLDWRDTQGQEPTAISKKVSLAQTNKAITLTASTLNLSIPNSNTAQITLYNLRGQQLQTQTLQLSSGRASVSLKGLKANGVYLAKVVSDSGTISRKFRVER